ncbi:MAG: ATP-dependent DNA helicase RecG [bacterium]
MGNNLNNPIKYLKSIGDKRAIAFAQIGITCIKDLLFYFPFKHLDRSKLLTIKEVVHHVVQGYEGEVTVIGKVIESEKINYGKKSTFKVRFKAGDGLFDCVWFQGINYFATLFKENDIFAVSGKPVLTKYGNLQIVHPDYDKLNEKEEHEFLHTGKIIPLYRVPKELKTVNMGEYGLRNIIHSAVNLTVNELSETLPENLVKKHNLLSLIQAVKNIHFPESMELLGLAINRFKFEELFYLECLVALKRQNYKYNLKGIPFRVSAEPIKKYLAALPFELTKSQLKVLSEIRKDMESPLPMNRLLQGDVGSGKTVVAVISMLIAVFNGYQAVLMAPTEILAQQHYKNIAKMLVPLNIEVNLLIGSQKKGERTDILSSIINGSTKIIIGTHALIEDKVEFNKLGLVIIDEQHRFGVNQRSLLIDKGVTPDILVMSATPIPRTLSMTVYGDLDLSVIDELPAGRLPIKTHLRGDNTLPLIYDYIIENSKKGLQTFLVYPLVEDSEKLDLKAAETYFEHLSNNELKDVRVALIHGKMNWKDKEEIMNRFAAKEYDVLISTTVIEVGIDIPDANLMIVNDSFRFGLSQLHQLRGRVGRSNNQSYCILIVGADMLKNINRSTFNFEYLSKDQIEYKKTQIRLRSMVEFSSGFDLSEVDLKLRGPGDIFGTKQSGFPELKFANIVSDINLLVEAKEDAFNIITNDPKLLNAESKIVKNVLNTIYQKNLHYANIA